MYGMRLSCNSLNSPQVILVDLIHDDASRTKAFKRAKDKNAVSISNVEAHESSKSAVLNISDDFVQHQITGRILPICRTLAQGLYVRQWYANFSIIDAENNRQTTRQMISF